MIPLKTSVQPDLKYGAKAAGNCEKRYVQALDLRGGLTIQNHGKNKTGQSFISENKHLISQNIQWNSLLSQGLMISGYGHDAFAGVGGGLA